MDQAKCLGRGTVQESSFSGRALLQQDVQCGHCVYQTSSLLSAQPGKFPELSTSLQLSCTAPMPSMKLIHHAATKQHSGDDFSRSRLLFPSVTSRNQRATEDVQSEWLFIITLLWQLGQHFLSLKYTLRFKSACCPCYKTQSSNYSIHQHQLCLQAVDSPAAVQ